jgi:hypothetical protein
MGSCVGPILLPICANTDLKEYGPGLPLTTFDRHPVPQLQLCFSHLNCRAVLVETTETLIGRPNDRYEGLSMHAPRPVPHLIWE